MQLKIAAVESTSRNRCYNSTMRSQRCLLVAIVLTILDTPIVAALSEQFNQADAIVVGRVLRTGLASPSSSTPQEHHGRHVAELRLERTLYTRVPLPQEAHVWYDVGPLCSRLPAPQAGNRQVLFLRRDKTKRGFEFVGGEEGTLDALGVAQQSEYLKLIRGYMRVRRGGSERARRIALVDWLATCCETSALRYAAARELSPFEGWYGVPDGFPQLDPYVRPRHLSRLLRALRARDLETDSDYERHRAHLVTLSLIELFRRHKFKSALPVIRASLRACRSALAGIRRGSTNDQMHDAISMALDSQRLMEAYSYIADWRRGSELAAAYGSADDADDMRRGPGAALMPRRQQILDQFIKESSAR